MSRKVIMPWAREPVGSRPGDGERRTRTADTSIFSRVLYQLSYLAATADPTASRVPRMSSPRYPSQPPPKGFLKIGLASLTLSSSLGFMGA